MLERSDYMDKRKFDKFSERFGYEIENYRLAHRIKQSDLAAQMHISQSALSKLEKGKTDMTLELFGKLLDICGTYAIFMFLLAYYPKNLKARVKLSCPTVVYKLFIAWTNYLKKKEPLQFLRQYDDDRFRII